MAILLTTIIILILKIIVFKWGFSFAYGRPILDGTFVICCFLFAIRCVIFKETEGKDKNFINHGDFISEFLSLAYFYKYQLDFKTALYFHVSFGFLHYFQYVFGFIIPEGFGLIWQGIRSLFSAPKRTYQTVEQPTPHPIPQVEAEVIPEEKPRPVKKVPKKITSIYDI